MDERYNATVDLLERNLAAGTGGRPYLVTDAKTFAYDEIAAAADGIGAGLLDLGLERGDRVLVLTQDGPELVCTFWGAMKVGVVPVLLAPALSAADLRFIIDDSRAKALVFDVSTERLLSAIDLGAIALLSVHASALAGARRWREIATPARVDAAPTQPDDTAFWLYTSGTTGTPKAVVHPHRNLRAAPDGFAKQVIGLGPGDVVLSASRMFFAYGLGNAVYLPAAAGAAVAVDPFPVSPSSIQGAIDRYRADDRLRGELALGRLRATRRGATLAVRAPGVLGRRGARRRSCSDRFGDRFGLPLLDGLGRHRDDAPRDREPAGRRRGGQRGPATRGLRDRGARRRRPRPRRRGERRALDARARPSRRGTGTGPSSPRARSSTPGSAPAIGSSVRDGRLYHEGRFDDLLKFGGIWVAPGEIEDVLRAHADVVEAAVVLDDHRHGVPLVKAFVRSARTDTGLHAELATACRARLASFKVPARVRNRLGAAAHADRQAAALRAPAPSGVAAHSHGPAAGCSDAAMVARLTSDFRSFYDTPITPRQAVETVPHQLATRHERFLAMVERS